MYSIYMRVHSCRYLYTDNVCRLFYSDVSAYMYVHVLYMYGDSRKASFMCGLASRAELLRCTIHYMYMYVNIHLWIHMYLSYTECRELKYSSNFIEKDCTRNLAGCVLSRITCRVITHTYRTQHNRESKVHVHVYLIHLYMWTHAESVLYKCLSPLQLSSNHAMCAPHTLCTLSVHSWWDPYADTHTLHHT